jgi:hypothetical protein
MIFGLFSDEGLIEGDFYTLEDAKIAKATRYTPDDELEIKVVCSYHHEHAEEFCELCAAEEETLDFDDEYE